MYSYDRRASSPFTGLSPELQASLNSFAGSLAFWMGNSTLGNIQAVARVLRESKELQAWLSRHVNLPSYTLFYGGRLKRERSLPEIGSELPRQGTILQWSTRKEIAQWFAGLRGDGASWDGGVLAQATVSGKKVLVDIDRFSMICGRHKDEFAALMTRVDPVQMFDGSSYEGEVITRKVKGTVVEARWF